ncbi:MAG: SDR family NAD(P)-dependent oxidoreductase [Patescibacteria group bacterium]|jgi:FlaA1/EpsC-like NDP-sugar epimerase
MQNEFKNKKILVTGGTGSIGSVIVKSLLKFEPAQIRVLSRDESKQQALAQELSGDLRVRLLIGDIRNKERVFKAMENIDIVFHAAAMKHVLSCENDPYEAVETNVRGMQNIIDCAMAHDVAKVVGISTDKATDPVSVMGCTKLLAEKVMLAHYMGSHPTKFCFVRFGNVLNSRGSVLPIFYKQIAKGGPVTVTDRNVARFFMSIEEAVELVFKASSLMQDREIFVLKNMAIVRIYDLAKAMIELYAPRFGHDPKKIKIIITGLKRGERMHEKLLTKDESRYALENKDMVIITPVITYGHNVEPKYKDAKKCRVGDYATEGKRCLPVEKIKKLLIKDEYKLNGSINNFYF